jgi:hypothetical protein
MNANTNEMDYIELLYRIFWRRRHTSDPSNWTSLVSGYETIQRHLENTHIYFRLQQR